MLVLGCILVVGVAVASILGRDSIPFFQSTESQPTIEGPTANRDSKKDRLPVATAPAAPEPDQNAASLPEPLRQAFAPDSPFGPPAPDVTAPVALPFPAPLPPPRPKSADRSPLQKNYSLLSDVQIAALKGRLRLTATQELYWPAVENALRTVAKKIHDQRSAGPGAPVNLGSADVEQLKTAATPLLGKLREDQKREARSLARIIGLEAIASLI